jgi:hypothetical protein
MNHSMYFLEATKNRNSNLRKGKAIDGFLSQGILYLQSWTSYVNNYMS